MFHRSNSAVALLLAGALSGAVACSREQPRVDEPLFIPPGTTSGGAGMGGASAPLAPQALYGTRSTSLGTTIDPTANSGAANSGAATSASQGSGGSGVGVGGQAGGSSHVNFGAGSPGAPGTVNGNYGPLPTSGNSGSGSGRAGGPGMVDSTATTPAGSTGGAITH